MKDESIDKMSRTKLIHELRRLQLAHRRFVAHLDDTDQKQVLYELEIRQIDLEMQNRRLRESQQRLEEARAHYSQLYNFAPIGCCAFDREGRIWEINFTGAALLEASREQLIGKVLRSIDARISPNVVESHLRKCVEENAPVTSDLTLAFDSGVQRIIRLITDPVTSGVPPTYMTAMIDITEEKRFEDEILLLSNLGAVLVAPIDYEEALDAAAHILVPALADVLKIDLLGDDGRIDRALVLFGDSNKQSTLGERLKQYYPRPGWATPQARVIESGEPILLTDVSDAFRDRMAHDAVHAGLLRAAGIRSLMVVPLTVRGRTFGAMTFGAAESGRHFSPSNFRLAGTVANRVAATIDNARLFAERKKAVSARDAILAVVSHDLRNSLNVIHLKTYLMSQSSEAHVRADGDFIQKRAAEMARFIQDLLDISSIEAGQLRLEKSPQTVGPIVKKVLETFESQAGQKGLKLETESTDQEQLCVYCDPGRVQQVLSNIIGNAIKFTGSGGSILVRVSRRDGEACFSVTDSGPGIPAADLRHIFDRFWSATKSGHGGTGLGLSIAKGLVETQGGHIWAESQIGAGSTFFFTLPLGRLQSPSTDLEHPAVFDR